MRRKIVVFIVTLSLLITFLVYNVFTLLSLLFERGGSDVIHSAEIPAPNSPLIENRPQLIPKIIHQTYINTTIPAKWSEARQSCLDLHEDYEYKLWTDEKARDFIAAEYPWFLDTFEGYSHPIQRADAIRYFVLAHFGGVYIDLDDGCNRRLDPLLSYPAWLRLTIPTGISNDAMGSVPQHPFFLRVIESLKAYNRKFGLPYITIMGSTGPLFLSIIWKKYKSSLSNVGDGADGGRVRLLSPDDYSRHTWSFFKIYQGSSWHGKDARLIFWMGKHWMLLTCTGFLIAGVVGWGLWWAYMRIFAQKRQGKMGMRVRNAKQGYELVERQVD